MLELADGSYPENFISTTTGGEHSDRQSDFNCISHEQLYSL